MAHHPKTPEKVLRRLTQHKALRVLFAQHSKSTPALLQVVTEMSSGDPSVLAYVAAHAHATEAILDALSGHPDRQVRLSVAGNEAASQTILEELTRDEHSDYYRQRSTCQRVHEVYGRRQESTEDHRTPHAQSAQCRLGDQSA